MKRTKVFILGSNGMLGSMVLEQLSGNMDLNVHVLDRDYLDANRASVREIKQALKGADWIINCIGIIKPHINEQFPTAAIRVNAVFPHLLNEAAIQLGAKVIQIATDCVYSGDSGGYWETDKHDPRDVYGKTKSLGEVHSSSKNFYNLRCSIIGPELKNHLSLLDWFLNQPEKGEVNGFTNHLWNGITTLQFARICEGIIDSPIQLSPVQHIVPANVVTKADLLWTIADVYHKDISVKPVEAPEAIDRTLITEEIESNKRLWELAGYFEPPTIEYMIRELKEAIV